MTNYIVPSSTPAEEVVDLAGLIYPCRITDLRTGAEHVFETAESIAVPIGQSATPPVGTTEERPIYSNASSISYFDKTLGIPIWYNGAVWVDSSGAGVDEGQEG